MAFDDELEGAMRRGYVAAHRILGTADEAGEATQEAAARALAARARYDESRPFYAWFHRILKNHCLDRLRRRRRQTNLDDEAALADPTAHQHDERIAARDRRASLNRAIAGLSDEHREVIELRHFADASYEEMAAIIGVPKGTVMSRLYRARKALHQALTETGGEP